MSLKQQEIMQLKQKMSEGYLPQWVVSDPGIYELELRQIFGKTWQFLGHESELKETGSYVTRWIAHDPVLLVRDSDGRFNAFLNSCAHRGVRLCTEDFGKKKTFQCPYHGWSYNLNGDLIGIVAGDKVFGQDLNKDAWGLRPIPRVESYQGMIFGNLDPEAMSLDEYLGDMKWYFDMMLGRSDGGMEVRGVPHRWIAKGNWKMTSENFAADPYHVQTTHRSTTEMGITPKDPLYASYGHQVVLNHGHGINIITTETGQAARPYQGIPESYWPMFEKNLSPAQADILKNATVFVGGVYPNLSFISSVNGSEEGKYNHVNFRVWRPISPDQIEIWVWYMIDKALPEDYKEKSYKAFIRTFGASGTLEQDDTENWARIVEASRGLMARDKSLSYNNLCNYLMGGEEVKPDPNFPGPGIAYPTTYTDAVARNMHEYWLELLTKDLDEEGMG
jgi:phenylpropionate dioxygenase-like ring-hydroxylating dioxygenase large terminal subunit